MQMYAFAALSLHVLAAVAWIGGMVFLSTVLVPVLRSKQATVEHTALFRVAARRFRIVVWLSILGLLSTGPVLLHARNVSLIVPNDWPAVVRIKIALVIVLLLLTIAHDLFLGPRGNPMHAMPEARGIAWNNLLIKTSRWVPRLALIVGILVVLVAVVLARS